MLAYKEINKLEKKRDTRGLVKSFRFEGLKTYSQLTFLFEKQVEQ